MKHLFFVSVALGIFSGTSISGKAQTSVNTVRVSDGEPSKRSVRFIEGIEIKTPGTSRYPVRRAASSTGSNIESASSLQFKYAQMMNTEVEAVSNLDLYNFIDEWWGTHYRYGGSTKAGIDCSAFAGTLLSKVYGIASPRTARAQYSDCNKLEREALKEGDLVFFNTRGGVSHVGVYLSNGYFAHASVGNGVTISSLDENYYSKKFIGGGRLSSNPEDCVQE
jgi:hypothetical protein